MMRIDLLVVLLAGSVGLQQPVPFTPRTGPDQPANDPVVVRGCVEGRRLKILRIDSADGLGLREIRLKGPKGVMAMLKDYQNGYVELTGVLDYGRRGRVDSRKVTKLGKVGTVTVSSSTSETSPMTQIGSEPTLDVVALTPLGERCPGA
jgi:hypothetical protein